MLVTASRYQSNTSGRSLLQIIKVFLNVCVPYFANQMSKTEISAGETPAIREACPME